MLHSASARADGEEITMLTWETYHDDDWLAEYRAKTGVKINPIRIGSNDESYEKLRSGAVSADMFILDTGSIERFKKAGLLAQIDPTLFPGTSNISPGLHWPQTTTVDGKIWSIPYNWGTQPLMYNPRLLGSKPTSWKALWDKTHTGKVSIPDDSYTVFPMVAIAAGAKDPFRMTDAEFDSTIQAFRDLRSQILTLARGFDDQTTIFASGDCDIGYCENISSVFQLQAKGKDCDYSFPHEGTPAWIDTVALSPKGANRKAVIAFINETLTPAWQARFITKSVNNGILDLAACEKVNVPAAVLNKTNIPSMKDPKFWANMVFFKSVENIDRRAEIWNAFKAGTL